MMNRRRSFTLSYRIERFIYDLPRLYKKYRTKIFNGFMEVFCAIGMLGFMVAVLILSCIR